MVETVKTDPAGEDQKPKSASGSAGWPFFDFASAFEVPQLIHARGGGVAELDQLAAWLNYKSTASGTFASKLASARYFGLIGSTERGRVAITDRARLILAPVLPDDALNAKAEAFLAVPLFKKVFEQFRGNSLPPDVGLRNLFQHSYQVPSDRVQQAVRVFKDSAKQTGFFDAANDRLIRPSLGPNVQPFTPVLPLSPERRVEERAFEQHRGGDDTRGIHAAILGLLRELPEPGQPWTKADQDGFLAAFTAMVKFIYPAKGEAEGA